MPADLSQLIAGVPRSQNVSLDAQLVGLRGGAAGVTLDMRSDPAHGDKTGGARASYGARAVGRGEDGSTQFAAARAAGQALNPERLGAVSSVEIPTELGVIIDSPMDYSPKLETENAGEKAVVAPTLGSSGERLTRAAAAESRRRMGG